MLPNKVSSGTKTFIAFILLALMFPAYAQQIDVSNLSAESILVNLNEQMPMLMRMVTAMSYVMGMYFILAGVLKLKHVGEMRTMMSHEHGVMGPIIMISVGALLLYLPTAVEIGLSTFWSAPNPYGYLDEQPDQWHEFYNVVFSILQFIGVIAFIRGLVILSHTGGQQSQQGAFGRGLTHIIGGIFCINIYQVVQVIMFTLGVQTT